MKLLTFSAFDTLFFREARPMEAVGGKPLAGRFPPSARTMSGAVRSLVGEALGVEWDAYRNGDIAQQAVREIIGDADAEGIGKLDLRGPFPMLHGERLYPAPLHLLYKNDEKKYVRLRPGSAVECDLGKVYLPELGELLQGAKPLEKGWLNAASLARVLSGENPQNVIEEHVLFKEEQRLGIALDQNSRTAEEGKLYQTVHARTLPGVEMGVMVAGLPDTLNGKLNQVLRLGGEGRIAAVEACAAQAMPQGAQALKNATGLWLMLCTAADFAGNWLPAGFIETQDAHGVTVWRGELAGVGLVVRCAVLGKSLREGGWDLKKRRSRPAVSLIPAGSVYFCEVAGDMALAAQKLSGLKIGKETELGRGELAVGYW